MSFTAYDDVYLNYLKRLPTSMPRVTLALTLAVRLASTPSAVPRSVVGSVYRRVQGTARGVQQGHGRLGDQDESSSSVDGIARPRLPTVPLNRTRGLVSLAHFSRLASLRCSSSRPIYIYIYLDKCLPLLAECFVRNNDPNGVTYDPASGLYHRFFQYDKTYSDECMHGKFHYRLSLPLLFW